MLWKLSSLVIVIVVFAVIVVFVIAVLILMVMNDDAEIDLMISTKRLMMVTFDGGL